MMYHEPVLLQESIGALVTDADGIYVDATFGGGGHSREILKRLGKKGKLIAFDQDEDASRNAIADDRFLLIRSNFRYMKNFLHYHHSMPVHGVLADLGISSHQVDTAERGFSTRFEAPLDMRMNNKSSLTASGIVNEYGEARLESIFREYGELREAKRLAKKISDYRAGKKIGTTAELMEIAKPLTVRHHEVQFFAKVFQALRIEVNQELEALKEFLLQCGQVIRKNGRLVVISYHSLEDRLVKNFIASGNFSGEAVKDAVFGQPMDCPFLPVNKKLVEPSPDEVKRNPRARSAKMRIASRNS